MFYSRSRLKWTGGAGKLSGSFCMLVVIFGGYRIVQDRLFESDFDKEVKWIDASRKKGEELDKS